MTNNNYFEKTDIEQLLAERDSLASALTKAKELLRRVDDAIRPFAKLKFIGDNAHLPVVQAVVAAEAEIAAFLAPPVEPTKEM